MLCSTTLYSTMFKFYISNHNKIQKNSLLKEKDDREKFLVPFNSRGLCRKRLLLLRLLLSSWSLRNPRPRSIVFTMLKTSCSASLPSLSSMYVPQKRKRYTVTYTSAKLQTHSKVFAAISAAALMCFYRFSKYAPEV